MNGHFPISPANGRNRSLDAIRGFGALIVVFWHLAVYFFPAAAWGSPTGMQQAWELPFYSSPFWVLLSGSYAVCLFFVLSGYVLTVDHFRCSDTGAMVRRMLGRAPRLAIPAAASTITIYALVAIYPSITLTLVVPTLQETGGYARVASNVVLSPDLSLRALFDNLFVLPWFQQPDFKRLYNGVLWTMYVEFAGSFMVLTLALALRRFCTKWMAAAVFVLAGFVLTLLLPGYGFYFAVFLAGGAIAALGPPGLPAGSVREHLPWLLIVVGLFLGGYNGAGLSAILAPLMFDSNLVSSVVFLKGIGAILTLLGVLWSKGVSGFLSNRYFGYLGDISFSLYLFHPFVILVIGLNTFWLFGGLTLPTRASLAALASLGGSFLVAAVATRLVDRPAITFARRFSQYAMMFLVRLGSKSN